MREGEETGKKAEGASKRKRKGNVEWERKGGTRKINENRYKWKGEDRKANKRKRERESYVILELCGDM